MGKRGSKWEREGERGQGETDDCRRGKGTDAIGQKEERERKGRGVGMSQ